jgi:hypothetical protein
MGGSLYIRDYQRGGPLGRSRQDLIERWALKPHPHSLAIRVGNARAAVVSIVSIRDLRIGGC